MRHFVEKTSFLAYLLLSTLLAGIVAWIYKSSTQVLPPYVIIVAVFTLMTCLILRIAVTGERRTKRKFSYLTIPLVMLAFWVLMHALFKDFNVQAIIYHAAYGFTSNGIPDSYLNPTVFITLGVIIIASILTIMVIQNKVFSQIDKLVFAPLILVNPLVIETYQGLGFGGADLNILSSHYQKADVPENKNSSKPNVLHIFLESAERTLINRQKFGPAMDPIREFENRGLSATNIHQVKSTEWTMAGMVAAQCGVPLIRPWLFADYREKASNGRYLPNTSCLGDILKSNGYYAEYLMGVDVDFGGTGDFYRDHGFTKVSGYKTIQQGYEEDLSDWGLSDSAVFDKTENIFRGLQEKDTPFLLTVTSMGGHGPHGLPSRECLDGRIELKSSLSIGKGMECANAIVRNMLNRLEKDGLLEDTIVILQSDHLLMGSEFSGKLKKMERRNLFYVFGPGIEPQQIERNATMMDVYPTLLELLGYELPDNKAGLGVSLLANEQNLIEKIGAEKLNEAIQQDGQLRRKLWLGQPRVASLQEAN